MKTVRKVALLHGAGYAGGELIRILLRHPDIQLHTVTSRSFAGKPVWIAHPTLRGQTDLLFTPPEEFVASEYDGILVAGEHGQSALLLGKLISEGYQGFVVDLSADFRLNDASLYNSWYGYDHPYPQLLSDFIYGIPEIFAPYTSSNRLIANPGCFATAISLALWPLSTHLSRTNISVNALTGASGSGARPKPTTHYPTRDGNVRAYKILSHQHLPEIEFVLNNKHHLSFIPVSGPWTRGIWGTAQLHLQADVSSGKIATWYAEAYENCPLIRLWPDALPELRYTVNTPFADIGWILRDQNLVIGFAIDNLLKGAASQAIQNLNILFGLHQSTGLTMTEIQKPIDSLT